MKKLILKKRFLIPVLLVILIMLGDYIVIDMTHGESKAVEITSLNNPANIQQTDHINVMTINMAHGRGNGKNQVLQSNEVIKENLTAIGQIIAREEAQVVAMQEADAASWWSGNYSHVNMVGEIGGMKSAIQGSNIDGLGLEYGAAIVTQLEVSNARQVTFQKSAPTPSKGFVMVACEWPGDPTFKFNVISLHLDFANKSVREQQLATISEVVQNSKKPVIMMGDFNTDMSEALLPTFIKKNQLQAWKPNDASIITFPMLDTRIDWILTSKDFQIMDQTVLDDVLSDHKILTAVIERAS